MYFIKFGGKNTTFPRHISRLVFRLVTPLATQDSLATPRKSLATPKSVATHRLCITALEIEVQRVEMWGVETPKLLAREHVDIVDEPVLSSIARVSWSTVLLKDVRPSLAYLDHP